MAHRTASTTLRNSTIAPSPVRLTTPVMHGEDRIDQIAPQGAEPSEEAVLVRARKPRVSGDIRYYDRRELAGLAHGANAEAGGFARRGGFGTAALPCCTGEDVEAGSAGPACRLAKPIHAGMSIARHRGRE